MPCVSSSRRYAPASSVAARLASRVAGVALHAAAPRNTANGSAVASAYPYAPYSTPPTFGMSDEVWHNLFMSYLLSHSLGFFYWCYNPDSQDSGGLVDGDWLPTNATSSSAWKAKLALLAAAPVTDVLPLVFFPPSPPTAPPSPPRKASKKASKKFEGAGALVSTGSQMASQI